MWEQGVFGGDIDGALFAAALTLCLGVAWHVSRRLGRPRFRGAIGVLWLVAAASLPIPTYFACGIGLWTGAALSEGLGLGASVGAAVGWVLVPALFSFVTLSLLGKRRPEATEGQAR